MQTWPKGVFLAWLLYPKAFDYEVIWDLGWMGLELYEKLAENLMNESQEFPGIHIQYATFVEIWINIACGNEWST